MSIQVQGQPLYELIKIKNNKLKPTASVDIQLSQKFKILRLSKLQLSHGLIENKMQLQTHCQYW
jgi:hypothetical protein